MGPSTDRRRWLAMGALLVLGAALFLPRLGLSGLWDPWEPRYAQAAREMEAGDHWIVPYYREDPRLNKPPMTYWMIRVSHAVFGVTEAAARLPSALLAVLCPLALAFAFCMRGRVLEGFLAGGALMTSPQWLLLGRFATPDMPLAAFTGIALALVIALPAVVDARRRRILLLLVPVAIAAAGLTDWPRGLLLPAWAVLGWAALRQGWKGIAALVAVAGLFHWGQLTQSVPLNLASIGLAVVCVPSMLVVGRVLTWRAALLGALLLAVLVAPWFAAAYHVEAEEMDLFGYKHGLNLGESVGYHTGPYDYVLRIVVIGGLPWAAAALVGFLGGFGAKADELARVLCGVWLGFMLFFTLSEAQMGHFYAVIQPSLACLAGIGVVALVRRRDWTAIVAAAALVGIGWLVQKPTRILETATVKTGLHGAELFVPAIAIASIWAFVLFVAWLRRREAWAVACVAPAAVLAAMLGWWLVPTLEPKKSLRPMWELYLQEREGPGEPIAAFKKPKDSGFYYSDNEIVRIKEWPELDAYLEGPGVRYLIGPKVTWNEIRMNDPARADRWELLDATHSTHMLARYTPPAP